MPAANPMIMLVLLPAGFVAKKWYDQQRQERALKTTTSRDQLLEQRDQLADRAHLNHASWQVRQAALRALVQQNGPELIPDLLRALADPDTDVRETARDELVTLGQPAMDGLIQALNGSPTVVPQLAAEALGRIGAPESVPALAEALKHHSAWVRSAAADALGLINTPAATDALKSAFAEEARQVRAADRRAVGNRSQPAENALQ
jgi:HEAT repeat protein